MKKFFNKLNRKVNNALISAQCAIENRKAEGYVDTGVKVLISVVIGGLLLALLYTLFQDTVMPTVTQKVVELFSYAG